MRLIKVYQVYWVDNGGVLYVINPINPINLINPINPINPKINLINAAKRLSTPI
jgi:hypothetical protein